MQRLHSIAWMIALALVAQCSEAAPASPECPREVFPYSYAVPNPGAPSALNNAWFPTTAVLSPTHLAFVYNSEGGSIDPGGVYVQIVKVNSTLSAFPDGVANTAAPMSVVGPRLQVTAEGTAVSYPTVRKVESGVLIVGWRNVSLVDQAGTHTHYMTRLVTYDETTFALAGHPPLNVFPLYFSEPEEDDSVIATRLNTIAVINDTYTVHTSSYREFDASCVNETVSKGMVALVRRTGTTLSVVDTIGSMTGDLPLCEVTEVGATGIGDNTVIINHESVAAGGGLFVKFFTVDGDTDSLVAVPGSNYQFAEKNGAQVKVVLLSRDVFVVNWLDAFSVLFQSMRVCRLDGATRSSVDTCGDKSVEVQTSFFTDVVADPSNPRGFWVFQTTAGTSGGVYPFTYDPGTLRIQGNPASRPRTNAFSTVDYKLMDETRRFPELQLLEDPSLPPSEWGLIISYQDSQFYLRGWIDIAFPMVETAITSEPPLSVLLGDTYTYAPQVSFGEGREASWCVVEGPEDAAISQGDAAVFSWTPTERPFTATVTIRTTWPTVTQTWTVTVPDVPAAPVDVDAFNVTLTTFVVTWGAAPSSEFAPVLAYEMEVRGVSEDASGDWMRVYGGPGREVVVNGTGVNSAGVLESATQYFVRVRARNVVGWGGWSAQGMARTFVRCPPGSFVDPTDPQYGDCYLCPSGTWWWEGEQTCESCPPDSESREGSTTGGPLACHCQRGFYLSWDARRVLTAGSAPGDLEGLPASRFCLACPQGAVCAGGTALPVAERGFYDVSPAAEPGQSFAVCPRIDGCEGGLRNASCATGYTGFMCGTCADDYFLDSTLACTRCPTGYRGLFSVFLVLVVVACVLMVFLVQPPTNEPAANAGSFDKDTRRYSIVPYSLTSGLVFVQMLALLSHSDLGWPGSTQTASRVLGTFLGDLNLFGISCVVSAFYARWMISVLLPVVAVVISVLAFVMARAVVGNAGWFRIRTVPQFLHFFVVSVGGVVYIPLCKIALEFFVCRPLSDGHAYFESDMSTRCYDGTYFAVLPVGVVFLLLYTLGVPLYILRAVLKIRSEPAIRHDVFFSWKYHPVFKLYRNQAYFYELLVYVRRLAFSVIAVAMVSQPVWQIMMFMGLFVGSTMLHLNFQPYFVPLYNTLELRMNLVLIVVVICGFAFYANNFDSEASRVLFMVVSLMAALTGFVFIGVSGWKEMQWRRRDDVQENSDAAVRKWRTENFWMMVEGELDDLGDSGLAQAFRRIKHHQEPTSRT